MHISAISNPKKVNEIMFSNVFIIFWFENDSGLQCSAGREQAGEKGNSIMKPGIMGEDDEYDESDEKKGVLVMTHDSWTMVVCV